MKSMTNVSFRCLLWLPLILGTTLSAGGCIKPGPPLEMGFPNTQEVAQDHWKIAALYTQQAVAFRQRAEELNNQAASYEKIFGADSDWVAGAKTLAQFYENSARDREREAALHLDLAARQSSGTETSGKR